MCTFLGIVGNEYEDLRDNFHKAALSEGIGFDEDVFGDTMLRCQEKFNDKDISRDEAISYFWKSFRNNTLREKYYHRNCLKADLGEHDAVSFEDDGVMLKNALGMMNRKYGAADTDRFLRHAEGESYKDIGDGFDKGKYSEMNDYLKSLI